VGSCLVKDLASSDRVLHAGRCAISAWLSANVTRTNLDVASIGYETIVAEGDEIVSAVIRKNALQFTWETLDPFIFCVHHLDFYPRGNESLGPDAPLTGRRMGEDFDLVNDWKMYHGQTVPGFPEHPHRGFETVTIVLEGFVDHFDSNGASGRYGNGDVQWMTAGSGLQHAEMFPLLRTDAPNTLHLFQIWLNLPQKSKFVAPHYKMLWNEEIPRVTVQDRRARESQVTVIAGEFNGIKAPPPAPDSWAADQANHLDIFLVHMASGARLALPTKSDTVNRALYFFKGTGVTINGETLALEQSAVLDRVDVELVNTGEPADFLVLQSEPIDEPVVQYGPFVMNTEQEIREAFSDYQRTRFGGWPWDRSDPVHPRSLGRVAIYADGTECKPEG
jgi:quercetin 2,3-dioxygenase